MCTFTYSVCVQSGCSEVIADEAGTVFQRLEHYNTHEYARGASSGSRKPSASFSAFQPSRDAASQKRRRGRPPKFPKHDIPVIPKLELDESAIRARAVRCSDANDPIIYGYAQYADGEACADDKCVYALKRHYHCVRQRCHHATDNRDVLNVHAKDFHSFVTIQPGFEFFDRNVNCRRAHCHNNKVNRHFHCVRPRCDYSFVRYSTMSQHDKKHRAAELGLTAAPGVGITMIPAASSSASSSSSVAAATATNDVGKTSYSGGQMKPGLNNNNVLVPGGMPRGADGLPMLRPAITGVGSSLHVSGARFPADVNVTSPDFIPRPVTSHFATVTSLQSSLAASLPSSVLSMSMSRQALSHSVSAAAAASSGDVVTPIVIQPLDEPPPANSAPVSSSAPTSLAVGS